MDAGFAEPEDVHGIRSVYRRYWLPNKYLCHLTIRVAAARSKDAYGVAHYVCHRLGGMRAFEVLPDHAGEDLSRPTVF